MGFYLSPQPRKIIYHTVDHRGDDPIGDHRAGKGEQLGPQPQHKALAFKFQGRAGDGIGEAGDGYQGAGSGKLGQFGIQPDRKGVV